MGRFAALVHTWDTIKEKMAVAVFSIQQRMLLDDEHGGRTSPPSRRARRGDATHMDRGTRAMFVPEATSFGPVTRHMATAGVSPLGPGGQQLRASATQHEVGRTLTHGVRV